MLRGVVRLRGYGLVRRRGTAVRRFFAHTRVRQRQRAWSAALRPHTAAATDECVRACVRWLLKRSDPVAYCIGDG